MEFSQSPDHDAIRDGIRRICVDFPDEYWSKLDAEHRFPWEFYKAMADAGLIVAAPRRHGV